MNEEKNVDELLNDDVLSTEKKTEEENIDVSRLLQNAETTMTDDVEETREKKEEVKESGKPHIFEKYKIKDIVFLAIMSACMLITGAVMPLVAQIPLFGIIQVCLGLQFSIFPVLGMMKTQKVGSLMFISVCCGVVMAFMNPVMFFTMLICALVVETLVVLIFRGYKKEGACLFAGTIYLPLTLPIMYLYYNFMYTFTNEEGQAVHAFVGGEPWVAVGMTVAVVAVCFIGSLIGLLISRELKKSGVLKK